jgi:uncharacterized protein YuzE
MKQKIEVVSSQMKAVEYDTETNTLIITFNKGQKYKYSDVPNKVFLELIEADSIGGYFIKEIKTKYEYKLI